MAHPKDPRLPAAGAALALGGVLAAGTVVRERAKRSRIRRERRYRLRPDEGAAEGLRRIARGQIDQAIEQLDGSAGGDRDTAVHEARKALKRLRALVRLARDELGDEVYRLENEAFRDAGRRLSSVRDAAVMLETLDGLVARYRDELADEPFAGLRHALAQEAGAARERIDRDATELDEVRAMLETARTRLATWPLRDDHGVASLAPGMERVYRRGRRALRAARRDPSDEALHELRKRAKDLWHAAQVARPASPKRLRRLARRAHALADATGDDHDLALLLAAAHRRPAALEPGELALLEGLVARRRRALQRAAFDRARRIYTAKPRRLARRIARAPRAAGH
jgi:CHAD domain-containing protein